MDHTRRKSDFTDKKVQQKGTRLTKSVLRPTDVEEEIAKSYPEDEVSSELCASILDVSLEDFCGPCKTSGDKQVKPEWFCNDCDDFLCAQCEPVHKGIKITSNHTLTTYQEVKTSQNAPCGPCSEEKDGDTITSAWYCRECDEFLCDSCRSYHKRLKVTRGHSLITKDERYAEVRQMNRQETAKLRVQIKQETAKPRVQIDKDSKKTTKAESTVTSVNSSPKPYMMRNVAHLEKYSASVTGDTEKPDIMGSSFISSSRFILADYKNKCLKLFDVTATGVILITKKDLKVYPRGIDVYDAGELAVGSNNGTFVRRFSITNDKIIDKGSIALYFICYDVGYINRKTLAAVGVRPPTFCVLSIPDETQLWKLDNAPDVFTNPWCLSLNTTKTRAYITDNVRNVVRTIDMKRHVVTSTIQLTDDAGPVGIASDAEDNLYVCNFGKNTVQQASPDCARIRTLMSAKDGIIRPLTISISSDGSIFLLGMLNSDNFILFKME